MGGKVLGVDEEFGIEDDKSCPNVWRIFISAFCEF
jgi:hypothetical protein